MNGRRPLSTNKCVCVSLSLSLFAVQCHCPQSVLTLKPANLKGLSARPAGASASWVAPTAKSANLGSADATFGAAAQTHKHTQIFLSSLISSSTFLSRFLSVICSLYFHYLFRRTFLIPRPAPPYWKCANLTGRQWIHSVLLLLLLAHTLGHRQTVITICLPVWMTLFLYFGTHTHKYWKHSHFEPILMMKAIWGVCVCIRRQMRIIFTVFGWNCCLTLCLCVSPCWYLLAVYQMCAHTFLIK